MQVGFAVDSNTAHQGEDGPSTDVGRMQAKDNNSISIPPGFENDIEKAQRLEVLRQQDPSVLEDLIGIYENILAKLPPREYLIFRVSVDNNLGNAYQNRIRGDRAENLEKAIQHYNKSLEVRTRETDPVNWAMTENNLAVAYLYRIRGDHAENLEKAIQHYDNSLEVYTREAYPVDWAMTENSLAIAYTNRIRGDRAENLEKAIQHYNNSLEVRTREADPVKWAATENNLAVAYKNRIRGDRAENLEKAIQHYNKSLEVRTREAYPVNWAMTENNLGNAYSNRIRGDHAENLEKAIQHYNKSAEVRTREAYPVNWAMTENNLAVAYTNRIRGDRAENLEKAIQHYNNSLEVYTREADPVNWAMTENNLAVAYKNRIRGDRAENLEKSIQHYNNSLEVYTREADPVNWATTEIGLGIAYLYRIRGDRAENLEKSIQHYNNSLEVYTREADPVNWATTENCLGIAYLYRIRGDHAENLEKAIQHYNNSLEVYTRETDPVNWAMTENNLAFAYLYRIRGGRAENSAKAIGDYQNALQIRTASSLPRDNRQTERNLGNLYFEQGRWQEALDAYKNAIAAGDLIYRSSLSENTKSSEMKENSDFYKNAAFAASRLNKTDESFLILEQGKTRVLTEALRLRMQQPAGVPNAVWTKYEQAVEMYRTLQATPSTKGDSVKALYERESEAQEALNTMNVTLKDIQKFAPSFQKDLELFDIRNMLDDSTALLSFCVTNKGSLVFVLTRSGGVKHVDVPGFNTTDLNRLIFESDNQGKIRGGWVGNISASMDIREATMDQVLAEIGQKLIEPAIAKIPDSVKKLIILPSGSLFLIPIHAAPIGADRLLCDRYVLSYAPSISLLIEMKEKAKERTGKGLYAVVNPTENLDFATCEGENISRLFPDSYVDEGSNCTLTSVLNGTRGQAYLHFACHGRYNWNDPTQSALILHNNSLLTLANLQENASLLLSARLVSLSACETGMTDILVGSADEYVGLPAGFMLSGAPCVLSSLWPVDDASTSLLMERFYSNHITKGMDIPSALQEAQHWVRGLTDLEVYGYVNESFGSVNSGMKKYYLNHYRRLARETPSATPFAHPYYWAGFTVNGA